MNEVEIQAKATIAAALIRTQGTYEMQGLHMYESDPKRHIQLGQLRIAVDMIYNALVNPK